MTPCHGLVASKVTLEGGTPFWRMLVVQMCTEEYIDYACRCSSVHICLETQIDFWSREDAAFFRAV